MSSRSVKECFSKVKLPLSIVNMATKLILYFFSSPLICFLPFDKMMFDPASMAFIVFFSILLKYFSFIILVTLEYFHKDWIHCYICLDKIRLELHHCKLQALSMAHMIEMGSGHQSLMTCERILHKYKEDWLFFKDSSHKSLKFSFSK